MISFEILHYLTTEGEDVFLNWLESLGDIATRARIEVRLARVERGLFGDFRYLNDGVSELKLDFGPGYRIYYGKTTAKKVARSLFCYAVATNRRNEGTSNMPSNIGKTTKRGTIKRVAGRSRSASHRDSTLEWLRKDPTHAAALLEAALETGDAGDFMAALRTVTEARGGVSKIAEETGLNREALYRTLSKKGNPQLSSLLPILQAAGLKLTVQAA